ncbi:MAG: Holliday junction resolvase RuvX [Candidatus Shikimatogenerans sp. AspAUS03]|uniref:Holliday junction resolvase RuvX n=1 Tax=Candidatus Shikimatogenerans sp. AspAUS03 TaxID=3158563 RepID=A0AAU7QSM7_9FLAO
MSKILSIDYGTKFSGLCLSNNKKNSIIDNKNLKTKILYFYIYKYITIYKVKYIVIGWPINYQNKNFKIINNIKKFLLLIINKFPNISYNFIDERFTSSYFKKKYKIKNNTINYLSSISILYSYLKLNNYV